jgi:hypothetical protein
MFNYYTLAKMKKIIKPSVMVAATLMTVVVVKVSINQISLNLEIHLNMENSKKENTTSPARENVAIQIDTVYYFK